MDIKELEELIRQAKLKDPQAYLWLCKAIDDSGLEGIDVLGVLDLLTAHTIKYELKLPNYEIKSYWQAKVINDFIHKRSDKILKKLYEEDTQITRFKWC